MKTENDNDFALYVATASKLRMTKGSLSQAIGFSPSAYCTWQRAGHVPEYVHLSCLALLHEANGTHGTRDRRNGDRRAALAEDRRAGA